MADSTHKSAAEIERELENERSALMRTLDEIQERLSFESLSNDVMGSLRVHSGDIGRSVSRSVKENPVPLALTAVGIAWLAFSSSRGERRADRLALDAPYGRSHGVETGAEREAAFAQGSPDRPVAGGRRPVYDASGRPLPPEEPDHSESRWDKARHAVSEARHRAGAKLHETRAEAGARLGRFRGGRRGKSARGGGVMSGLRQRGQGAYASAAELRERITHGTRDMSEQARARVLAARTRAYEAQLRAEHYTTRGRDRAVDFYEEQPLLAGALALAAGAVLGAALPRTQREDSAFGRYRDDLFEEAERIYREERAKLGEVARATAEEARDVARGTARDIKSEAETTASDIGDKTRAAAKDVADTAKSEAEDKDLGQRS